MAKRFAGKSYVAKRLGKPPASRSVWNRSTEFRSLGVRMLDPVVREFPNWTYADYVAGPSAAARIGCAAVASVSRGEVMSGETIFLITSLRSFGHDGLTASLRSLGRIDEVTLVDES